MGPWLQDGAPDRWLAFGPAREVFVAHRLERVVPTLAEVCRRVEAAGRWAAGFVAYEAAPAFAPALVAHPPAAGGPPLLFFTLHDPPRRLRVGPSPAAAPWPAPDPYRVGPWRPSVDEDTYRRRVEEVRRRIALGDTYQVNYTYRLRAPFEGDPRSFFLDLAAAQLGGYGGWLEAGDRAVCSASPELFFELADGVVATRPMKGTAPRGRWPEEDRRRAAALAASEKEQAENLMIVDMMRNDLGRVAEPGSVEVPSLFAVERYPTVWQMTSTVTARLAMGGDSGPGGAGGDGGEARGRPADAGASGGGGAGAPGRGRAPHGAVSAGPVPRVFAALFPCASITGAPKASTSAIIRELEDGPRGVYTGALGWIAPGGRARFGVAIRTAVVDRRRGEVEYGVGGGIVWDSDPQREAAESRLKARVLPRGAEADAAGAPPAEPAWLPPGAGAAPGRVPPKVPSSSTGSTPAPPAPGDAPAAPSRGVAPEPRSAPGAPPGEHRFELLETLLWTPETGIFLLDEHLDRLEGSAVYFGWAGGGKTAWAAPEVRTAALRALEAAVAEATGRAAAPAPGGPVSPRRPDPSPVPASPPSPAPPALPPASPPPAALRLRLLAARDGSVRVEATPLAPDQVGAPRRETADALPAVPVALATEPVDGGDLSLFHKTTRRTVYERAWAGRPPGAEEVLLWNRRRELTEGATTNLVVSLEGRLLTPPVRCGLLAGTFRRRLVQGGTVEEGVVTLDDLPRCDGLWLVNSVRRWRRARLLP